MQTPLVDDQVKVTDQNSEYRGQSGVVVASLGNQMYSVRLDNHPRPVNLRFTQLKVSVIASPAGEDAAPTAGNDPDGSINPVLVTPKQSDRRDVYGSGYNPHGVQGTTGDVRSKPSTTSTSTSTSTTVTSTSTTVTTVTSTTTTSP